MHEIAFVTTCKGRLHHIKETLPLMVAESPAEIVVVDYGCPDKTGDWVESEFPQVKVVRISDDPGFNLSRARNFGAQNSTSPWLLFIDADIKILPGWMAWLQANIDEKHFYLANFDKPFDMPNETCGTVLCPRMQFVELGGYDEAMRGWGYEDLDLYNRLTSSGLVQENYPNHFIEAISHSDEERTTFHQNKDIHTSEFINHCYAMAKERLIQIGARNINKATRYKLFVDLEKQLSISGKPVKKTFSAKIKTTGLIIQGGHRFDIYFHIQRKRRFWLFGNRTFKIEHKISRARTQK